MTNYITAEIRERHKATVYEETVDSKLERCSTCPQWWPCDAIIAANHADKLADQRDALAGALRDALEGMEDMILYVPDYFVDKHGHGDYIIRARLALGSTQGCKCNDPTCTEWHEADGAPNADR